MEITIGGQRVGSGTKMQAEMPHYEMSTQNFRNVRKTTLSTGTLVPVLKIPVQAGDRIKMGIEAQVITPGTISAVYGSQKFQIDVFTFALRLYNAKLHNNQLGIGLDMTQVKFPQVWVQAPRMTNIKEQINSIQIHPSSILAHLGIMGVGRSTTAGGFMLRQFNAYPWIGYIDIFKNYYANPQETNAYVIHTAVPTLVQTITGAQLYYYTATPGQPVPAWPAKNEQYLTGGQNYIEFGYSGATPIYETVQILLDGEWYLITDVFTEIQDVGNKLFAAYPRPQFINKALQSWTYTNGYNIPVQPPKLTAFPLANIDTFRDRVFLMAGNPNALDIKASQVGTVAGALAPYTTLLEFNGVNYRTSLQYPQEGLLVKTYQSDRYNNWLATSTVQAVNSQTAVSTVGNAFTIASMILGTKMYEMQNAIMTSGGTFDDWQETMYNHKRYSSPEIPIYHGGLTKELVFQEVTATATSESDPLGSIAAKGRFGEKHKGGYVEINVDEAGYMMAIASLTPRIDYTQGNDFDVRMTSLNNWHKPILDQIGFQGNITDQYHYLDTAIDASNNITYSDNGYVPAWIDWKTTVDQAKGNFAIKNNKGYMIFARDYTINESTGRIQDATTYIDPSKYNYPFAQISLDAMNYDLQVFFDMQIRRKISNQVMPRLK